jgi:hypothetical protein
MESLLPPKMKRTALFLAIPIFVAHAVDWCEILYFPKENDAFQFPTRGNYARHQEKAYHIEDRPFNVGAIFLNAAGQQEFHLYLRTLA